MGKHVIIGSGPVGLALLEKLSLVESDIVVINRAGTKVNGGKVVVKKADVLDYNQLFEASQGASVIYLCASPAYTEWHDKYQSYIDNVIRACNAHGAKLVYADNLYMYGETKVMKEDSPYLGKSKKGLIRGNAAKIILEAHNSGKIKAAIARSSDFYGPGVVTSIFGESVFKDAIEGKKLKLLGNTNMLHSVTYIGDFGQALAVLGREESALGKIWHVPTAPAISGNAFVEQMAKQIGHPLKTMNASKGLMSFMGLFNKQSKELVEMFYMYDKPFVLNSDKFTKEFKIGYTSIEEGISNTLIWIKNK
ncbi:MAG: NAD-dependent epimerase/dehydratase family protein [Bacilli bacterium]